MAKTELRLPPVASPNDRFKLYPLPVVHPGKCACCGAVDRPVVDFDMTIQFYGAVFLCITCLTEAARVIGMVPAVELRAAEEGATQSFEQQLETRRLKTISDEYYESAIVALGSLSGILLSLKPNDFDMVAREAEQPEPTLFDSDGREPEKSASIDAIFGGFTKSDSDLTLSQGPDSVSGSNVDGKSIFNL